ncbi:DCC1-like thiol-disulfide oxidoreductase family protein [Arcicella aquatica]|uniref:DCC1-like thiol-disulfide oxidoreductase family protein n=1 Tax=Arcicella aquatica TaxID=217141 RepID=A0ABU5QHS8_9BACT|nr:DCC1-like thiol-disulfide oxidoreductase family protein [Arcicella aquatica]MEA5256299.1 DCC1-like thiol-disulfide oxidoreductase family protein [Arcicella aquatica]
MENIDTIVDGQQVILFDGVCNFCNASINFVIDHDPNKHFKFASLQSEFGDAVLKKYQRNTTDFDSVILLKNNRIFTKSKAALEIAKDLCGCWKYLSLFSVLPSSILDFFYDLIAKNRYKIFGKSDSCRMPTPEFRERFL